MSSIFLKKAEQFDEEWEYSDALEECIKGIKQGDYDCAYLAGLICAEHLDEPDIDKAIEFYRIGSRNNNKECQLELGKLLVKENDILLISEGLKWLSAAKYDGADIKTVVENLKTIVINSRNLDEIISSIDGIRRLISYSKFSDKNFLRNICDDIVRHLVRCSSSIINNYNDLIKTDCVINIFKNSYFLNEDVKKYNRNREGIVTRFLANVNYALENINKFNKSDLDIIYKYVAYSFLNGKNGVEINFEEAFNYCKKCKTIDTALLSRISESACEYYSFKREITKIELYVDSINKEYLRNKYKSLIRTYKEDLTYKKLKEESLKNADGVHKLISFLENIQTKNEYDREIFDLNCLLINKYNELSVFYELLKRNDINRERRKILYDISVNKSIYLNEDQYKLLNKCKLLIFDMDGTVFDTDFMRMIRTTFDFNIKNYLGKINYVSGFKHLFLDTDSDYNLKKNKVLLITSSKEDYCKEILSLYDDFSSKISYPVFLTSSKKYCLKEFLSDCRDEFLDIIAFGDDEKDANIYSELKLKFFIIKNGCSYPSSSKELDLQIQDGGTNFRNRYLYDCISKYKCSFFYGFKSNFIDDIVVYFKNFNATYFKDVLANCWKIKSSNTPAQSNGLRKHQKLFDNFEFTKDNKNITLSNLSNFFINQFNDLKLDSDVVLCRNVGHGEIKFNYNNPITLILKSIARGTNAVVIDDLIKRKIVVEESKLGNRSIINHLNSTEIDKKFINLIKKKTIYIFDDICTTGTSLMACAELLYRAGAGHVVCFAFTKTCGDGNYIPKEIQ